MAAPNPPGFPETLPATPEDEPSAAGLVLGPTTEVQLAHRTIRSFTDEAVPEEVVATLLDVARHSSTSGFLQQVTVIRIKDPQIRQTVYESSLQPYVGGSRGELFIFVVDLSRMARVRQAAGVDMEPVSRATTFFQGVDDTMIAAQNLLVAAESMGFGACFLGSIRANPRSIIEAMKLPKYTFPLVGMLVGVPNQDPQMKPRLPRIITTSVDAYPDYESEEYRRAWAQYDQDIQTYYDLREGGARQDAFTSQLINKPGKGRAEQTDILRILHEQGLCTH